MKTIDIVISDLCEQIDRLEADRDLWKSKYEECSKRFAEFIDSSIKNGEVTSKNWVLYALTIKKYKVAWENIPGHIKLGSQVFSSWDECQKECEKLDAAIPTVRHWPEVV